MHCRCRSGRRVRRGTESRARKEAMKHCAPIIAALVALLALAGCTAPAQRAPDVQQVFIPTPVPCKVFAPTKPAFAVDALPIGSGVFRQMSALRAERKQRQGYEAELEAAILACQ